MRTPEYTPEQQGRILGVNRRSLPSPLTPITGQKFELVVVLVGGRIGDYAAYMGMGTPEFVKEYGNKISFEEACCHFPGGQLERERYRD